MPEMCVQSLCTALFTAVMLVLLYNLWSRGGVGMCGGFSGFADKPTGNLPVPNHKQPRVLPRVVEQIAGDDSIHEMDYQSLLQDMALSVDMQDDHRQHVEDTLRYSAGVSKGAIFDHDVNLVPWVGLRRPNYRAATPQATARSVPTEYNHQLPEYKPVCF